MPCPQCGTEVVTNAPRYCAACAAQYLSDITRDALVAMAVRDVRYANRPDVKAKRAAYSKRYHMWRRRNMGMPGQAKET